MGGAIGGIIGGVGGMIGASQQADAARDAANIQAAAMDRAGERALTGYNFLTSGSGSAPIGQYINAGTGALGAQSGVQNTMLQLLGLAPAQQGDYAFQDPNAQAGSGLPPGLANAPPMPGTHGPVGTPPVDPTTGQPQVGAGVAPGTAVAPGSPNDAFQNYLNSTGYQFQLGQGMDAITGSAAAKGMLNSGSTLKGLSQYGQNLGSTYFQNYLNQLGNMNNILGGTATAGQNALGQIATAGTAGGGQAASAITQGAANQGAAIMQGGNAMANGIAGLGQSIGNAFNSLSQGGGGGSGYTGTGGLW